MLNIKYFKRLFIYYYYYFLINVIKIFSDSPKILFIYVITMIKR